MSKDTIYREDAIKALGDAHFKNWGNAVLVIQDIPTIETKRGKWIYQFRDSENEEYKCSECDYPTRVKYSFCPNCGADMREVRDE